MNVRSVDGVELATQIKVYDDYRPGSLDERHRHRPDQAVVRSISPDPPPELRAAMNLVVFYQLTPARKHQPASKLNST